MRSVFLLFESQLSKSVIKFLDEYCGTANGKSPDRQWIVLCDNDPCLYVYESPLCEDDLAFEDGIPPLYSLMEEPTVWMVDVSGRHDGTKEVMKLAAALLLNFPLYLMDDYTNHCWTLEEITGNKIIEGRCFFDHSQAPFTTKSE